MRDLEKIREELDRVWDYALKAQDAVLAQRRRTKELEAADHEERAGNPALPNYLRG